MSNWILGCISGSATSAKICWLVASMAGFGAWACHGEELISGRVVSDPMVQAAWREGPSTPKATHDRISGATAFACPFASQPGTDRFFWDRTVRLDLSQAMSLVLDLELPEPAAFRSLLIYFESGDGWYVWGRPVSRAGRQPLRLSRDDFTVEGKPAGWHRITRIRLSPYRGEAMDTRLIFHGLRSEEPRVIVVRGTTSVPSPAEQRIAASVAERISGWLAAVQIPHAVIPDDQVSDATLARASVAVLGYNPAPGERELAAISRFVKRGGKLVVCYSSSAPLAALLGFKLGEYTPAEDPLRWTSFVFDPPRDWPVPERVFQRSGNIRPVSPAAAGARVIAWWEGGAGAVRTRDPAWAASPQGFWMSHILTAEDPLGKRDLLAGLLTRLDPALGPHVIRGTLETCGRIDSYPSFEAALSGLRAGTPEAPDPVRVGRLLDEAVQARGRMTAAAGRTDVGAVLEENRTVRRLLVEAYARSQRPRPGERRGIWDHDAVGWFPGDWERTCALLKRHGITDVFVNALWPGLAHFNADTVARSYTVRTHGDQLEKCIRAAHRHGLKVHLWKVCWSLENAPADVLAAARRERRLQADAQGGEIRWLNPCLPDNYQFEMAPLREAVRRYALDGVHFDYIRYPGAHACYGPETRAAFERQRGSRVRRWPAEVQAGGTLQTAFQDWRMQQQTDFVRRAAAELRTLRPGLQMSAAVFGNYPDCRLSIAQDWRLWLEKGYLDFVCPMNYTENLSAFTGWVARQTALPAARGRIWPGIGVTSNEAQLGADQVIEQVLAARRLGAPGFVLFQMDGEARERILPVLSLGLTAE